MSNKILNVMTRLDEKIDIHAREVHYFANRVSKDFYPTYQMKLNDYIRLGQIASELKALKAVQLELIEELEK